MSFFLKDVQLSRLSSISRNMPGRHARDSNERKTDEFYSAYEYSSTDFFWEVSSLFLRSPPFVKKTFYFNLPLFNQIVFIKKVFKHMITRSSPQWLYIPQLHWHHNSTESPESWYKSEFFYSNILNIFICLSTNHTYISMWSLEPRDEYLLSWHHFHRNAGQSPESRYKSVI